MHERFTSGLRAAAYVGSGLQTDLGDVMVEVSFHHRDRVVRRVCSTRDAGNVVGDFCKDFPKATVYYHTDSAYGFVAQVRCHCEQEKTPGCCKHGGHHRAHVLVVRLPVEAGATAGSASGG